ncbi:MAG: phage protein Gp36 family protein [Bilophila wadsworthia]
MVVSVAGDIARYRLTGGDIDTDPIRERYPRRNWLRDVADGKAGIGLPPGNKRRGRVAEPGTRPWDGVTP